VFCLPLRPAFTFVPQRSMELLPFLGWCRASLWIQVHLSTFLRVHFYDMVSSSKLLRFLLFEGASFPNCRTSLFDLPPGPPLVYQRVLSSYDDRLSFQTLFSDYVFLPGEIKADPLSIGYVFDAVSAPTIPVPSFSSCRRDLLFQTKRGLFCVLARP